MPAKPRPRRRAPDRPLRLTRHVEPTDADATGRPWRVTIFRALQPDGTPLWPEHTALSTYQELWESGGGPLFACTFMQDPSALAGDIFKPEWLAYYAHPNQTEDVPSAVEAGRWVTMTAADLLAEGRVQAIIPDLRELVSLQACDLALKKEHVKDRRDPDFYARATVYASRDGMLYVEDVHQARLTETEMIEDATAAGHRYRCKAIGIETVSFQALVFQRAVRSSHLPFVELDPGGLDKVVRARALSARYQARAVYHLYGARWLQALESQLLAFPHDSHDDQVDALTYAYELAVQWAPGSFAEIGRMQEELRKGGRGLARDGGFTTDVHGLLERPGSRDRRRF